MLKRHIKYRFASTQQGYVILLIVLAMLTMAGTFLISNLGNGTIKKERQIAEVQTTNDTLIAAKFALLGYILNTQGDNPGYLPVPDSLANGLYDGKDDDKCLSNATNGGPPYAVTDAQTQRCLGKFPWKTLALDVGNPSAADEQGQVPWVAISSNLSIKNSCVSNFNSDFLNRIYSGAACNSTTALPFPWLTVMDVNGNNVSVDSDGNSNIAAVLILPGSPLTTQSRTQSRSTTSNPKDYLDDIQVPLDCIPTCTAYDNAGLNNVFIQIAPNTLYPQSTTDTTLRGQPIPFNDTLIYVTKDEVLAYIEKRVVNEMASALRAFKTNTGKYPWAAPFTSPSNFSKFIATPNTISGLFPFFDNGGSAGSVTTTFGWAMPNAATPVKSCVAISGTRYVDSRQLMRTNIAALKTAATSSFTGTGSCTWKGTQNVVCTYTGTSPSVLVNMTRYTNPTCTTSATTRPYNIARTVTLTVDSSCSSPTLTYAAPTATDNGRWTWQCSSPSNQFDLEITDSGTTTALYPTLLPFTGNATVSGIGTSPVTMSSMFYQPPMPGWFYSKEWYKTAFYTVAPSSAPTTPSPNPCGSVTTLTVGGTTSAAVAILAGKDLSTPVVVRDNNILTNYLESPNSTGGTNCAFASVTQAHTPTYSDTIAIPAP